MRKSILLLFPLGLLLPAWATADDKTIDYPINFDTDTEISRTDRLITGLNLTSPADGDQTIAVSSDSPNLLYKEYLTSTFYARSGETLDASIGYTGSWMHSYVYLDLGSDGAYSTDLNDDYTRTDSSDVMSFSYLNGYNSTGTAMSSNNIFTLPSFTLPDLAEGIYRMRWKVDWNSIDPGGKTDSNNLITDNGGYIVDVRLCIHGDNATLLPIAVTSESNEAPGMLTLTNGTVPDTTAVPFGEDLTLRVVPGDGYTISSLTITHGYNISSDSLVHSTPQYFVESLPAYLLGNDTLLVVPGEYIDGDVQIEATFAAATASEVGEDYPVNFDSEATNDNALSSIAVTSTSGGTTTLAIARTGQVYTSLLPKAAHACPGDTITVSTNFNGDSLYTYLYIDLNQNGQFLPALSDDGTPMSSSELVSYNYYNGLTSEGAAVEASQVAYGELPAFVLHEKLSTGIYRVRLKLDDNSIDPAGLYNEETGENMASQGGAMVDFLLNVHNESHAFDVETTNGSVHGSNYTGLPLTYEPFSASIVLVPTAVSSGYEAEGMTIRHGHGLDGEQYIHGNRQWSEYTVDVARYRLPADSIDGDVLISLYYEPTEEAIYLPVWSDEFDLEDGAQPDDTKWARCTRRQSAWNRFLSDTADVIFIDDGKLVARCIPNKDTSTDNVDMLSGGVWSQGLYSFLYGKIEARILTNPYSGNFPAFWMMPADQSDGWPVCGEIDIWEQINTENKAYHTVHSNWTYNLGYTSNPTSSYSETVQMDRYHTYGFEWTEDLMKWYVDGKQVASYAKSTTQSDLDSGQWPFDKAFHIILNQSVGNGSWAYAPTITHTYETRFDWVRVYQIDEESTGMNPTEAGTGRNDASLTIKVAKEQLSISVAQPTNVVVCDLTGRKIFAGEIIEGTKLFNLPKSVYLVNHTAAFVP